MLSKPQDAQQSITIIRTLSGTLSSWILQRSNFPVELEIPLDLLT